MSPIEQVRCTKVPYRIYIYIYIYDRFPATFCVAPALQNPPIACLRGARSVSDGGTVRASAPCRRLHESLADFHRDLYRFQAVRRLFIGKPVENRWKSGKALSLFLSLYIYVWKVSRNFADCIGRAMHNPMETMTGKTYGDKNRKAGRKLFRLSDRAILSQDFPTTLNRKYQV